MSTETAEAVGMPVQFSQYMYAMPMLNPSYLGTNGKVSLNVGNLRNSGGWSDVTTYYGFGSFRLGGSSKIKRRINFKSDSDSSETDIKEEPETVEHNMGARFYGDYEGQYLGRTGIYGMYSVQIPVGDNLKIAGGAGFGARNYSVKASSTGGDGSAWAPDGDVGFRLSGEKFNAGFSINQVFNSTLQPYQEITRLKRHYGFNFSYDFTLSPEVEFRPALMLRAFNTVQGNADLSGLFTFMETLTAGVNYRQGRSLSFLAGLEQFSINEGGTLQIMLSYSLPMANTSLYNTGQYEITMCYKLR
ncbi:MAG: PorP/SprF family type IX secretion system membrane protein [Bacteroidota bacterium]